MLGLVRLQGVGVWSLGFAVQGSGLAEFRVFGGVWGLGFRLGLRGFRAIAFGFRVWGMPRPVSLGLFLPLSLPRSIGSLYNNYLFKACWPHLGFYTRLSIFICICASV